MPIWRTQPKIRNVKSTNSSYGDEENNRLKLILSDAKLCRAKLKITARWRSMDYDYTFEVNGKAYKGGVGNWFKNSNVLHNGDSIDIVYYQPDHQNLAGLVILQH